MIRRPRVLDPDETPDQELIVYRGSELDDVRTAVKRLRRGRESSPFVLHGPPGTGKTMVARHVLEDHVDDAITTAYVDCWHDYDSYHLLEAVVDALGLRVVHHNSTPHSALIDALQTQRDETCVVVLDELELVQDADPLVQLSDAPGIEVVAIVNDPDEIQDQVSAAWGSLHDRQYLQFASYGVGSLTEIMRTRAEHGLRDGALPERRAEDIAESVDGDARLGICTLREAAKQAQDVRTNEISPEHICSGLESAQRELHQRHLDRLTDHQRVLYSLLSPDSGRLPATLHEDYSNEVDTPRSLKSVRSYLRKMEWYGLVTSDGTTRDREYRIDTTGYVEPDMLE